MKRIISITSLVIAVLLLFTACGIPKMFRWENNVNYSISGRILQYLADDKVPVNGFPRMKFYYAIGPTSGVTVDSRLASSLSSSYSNNVLPDRARTNHEPLVSTTISIDGESSRIGLYEFTVINGDRPVFPSVNSYTSEDSDAEAILKLPRFMYADWLNISSQFNRAIRYTVTTIRYGDGYAVELTLNSDAPDEKDRETYILLRDDGETFKANIGEYISTSSYDREFEESDSPETFNAPAIIVFVTCSFAFNSYTSRYTIPLTVVGSIELTAL